MLGCGTWEALLLERGGEGVLDEIPLGSLNCGGVLDGVSVADVTVAEGAGCATIAKLVEPYEHELGLFRDGRPAWVGPVTMPSNSGTIAAKDLSHWMEVRAVFGPRLYHGDATGVFMDLFADALEPDPSPNVSIVGKPSGVLVDRALGENEAARASDLQQELARSALDYTTIGRTVYVNGLEAFAGRLVLHDEGVVGVPEVVKDGDVFATDVVVVGGTPEGATAPVMGRATRAVGRYGLVQIVVYEPLILDLESANANARARLEAMQPAPRRVTAALSPEAACAYEDLVSGVLFDVYLSEETTRSVEVSQRMRLQSFDVTASQGLEAITVTLIPLGVTEAA